MDEKYQLLKHAQKDLISFCHINNPNFVCGKHHDIIADVLRRTLTESDMRVIITAPPRHGKSHLVSENFPAWYIGNRPDHYSILCSYGQELASDFGTKVRNTVNSDNFQAVFPNITLSKDSKSKKRFNTNKGGSYVAVGRGGSITGRGGHVIIIDDLIKDEKEAQSELIRRNCIEWYKQTLYTRLMKGGSIIVMATRWHEADLIGYLKNDDHENWETIDLPAIDENDQALWPEFYPMDALQRIKKTLGTRNFESLYQQNPRPAEGALIRRSWLNFYSERPVLSKMKLIQSWDMAFKGSDTSDFVVGQIWGVYKGNFYLIDRIKERLDFPGTIKAFLNLTKKYPSAITKLVEAKANGQAVIDTLKVKIPGIIAVEPDISKEARVNAVAPVYESGNVYYPSSELCPWIDDHIEEIIAFPFGKNDDSVDAESQALKKLSVDCNSIAIYDNIDDCLYI